MGTRVSAVVRAQGRLGQWCLHAALLLAASLALAPFAWTLTAAANAGPHPWSAFSNALRAAPIPRYLANSLVVAGSTAIGQTTLAALAAYVFARLRFRGRDQLFLLFLGTLIVPNQITILPTYILLRWLGWLDSYAALVLPALVHPFSVFLLRQHFLTVSSELEDAALLDGSSRLGLLRHIFLPLARPALGTVGLFSFLWSWNSFLWPLIVLYTPERYTLPVGLSLLRSELGSDWPTVTAAALIATLPIVLLFLIGHRWLWRGLAVPHFDG